MSLSINLHVFAYTPGANPRQTADVLKLPTLKLPFCFETGFYKGKNTAVSFDNFVHLTRQIYEDTKRTRKLWQVFREFDPEKKGYIEASGIKHVLTKLDIEHTDTDVKLMVETADSDGDGRVDYEDFLQMFTETNLVN